MKLRYPRLGGGLAVAAAVLAPAAVGASSHREAPFISKNPKVDATDFYLFNSYEPSRAGYVTLIANYQPLQDAYGGPNYFALDPEALYEIHVDNTGDGVEDVTFQFDFDTALASNGAGTALSIGGKSVAVPLATTGPLSAASTANQNALETYQVALVRGDRRSGDRAAITARDGAGVFRKPFDNAGTKTIADYPTYASSFIKEISIPGCTPPAGTFPRVFVGQRAEGFAVNLGQIFDLVNMGVSALGIPPTGNQADLTGAADQGKNIVANKNVTTIALEVPAACLTGSAGTTIAGWTTASVRQARVINPTGSFEVPAREGGPWVQVSRLGMVLVNEIVIGLPDKDKFNGSSPKDDGQFADYVTNPTLPALVEAVFGATGMLAPTQFPRADLVAAFLNGVPTVNVMSPTLFEAVRLNTGVPATLRALQSPLGAATCFDPPANDTVGPTLNLGRAGCDPAGFPNGRRPGDDTVDIALRVAMGFLLPASVAPIRAAPLVDGAAVAASDFGNAFPYLNAPRPGSQ